ncbi:hypothetical protein R3P38DRAFT_2787387 [Favolaschia claudopus]|uniref:Uncharacterized protein n=1 Tax=Favolaschia claudopus TaxID=2862362 RepID=A0AAW0APA7_9AGAR
MYQGTSKTDGGRRRPCLMRAYNSNIRASRTKSILWWPYDRQTYDEFGTPGPIYFKLNEILLCYFQGRFRDSLSAALTVALILAVFSSTCICVAIPILLRKLTKNRPIQGLYFVNVVHIGLSIATGLFLLVELYTKSPLYAGPEQAILCVGLVLSLILETGGELLLHRHLKPALPKISLPSRDISGVVKEGEHCEWETIPI